MKISLQVTVGVALGWFMVAGVQAQEVAQPGPQHQKLKELVGEWEAEIDLAGNKSQGKMIYKMGPGDLWLISEFSGDFGGQDFEGHGLDSYDSKKGKFVAVWVDSMSTSPMQMEGSLDKEGKVLTMVGKGPGPDGKEAQYKGVTEFKDKETHVYKMYGPGSDGKEMLMMTIQYKRKK